jgi:hypothetical protein
MSEIQVLDTWTSLQLSQLRASQQGHRKLENKEQKKLPKINVISNVQGRTWLG